MDAKWYRGGGMGKKGEGIKKYKLAAIKNTHRDVKYNVENIVNNIVITIYGAR